LINYVYQRKPLLFNCYKLNNLYFVSFFKIKSIYSVELSPQINILEYAAAVDLQ